MRVALFSPLPPCRSGIADYSETLVEHLKPLVDLEALLLTSHRAGPLRFCDVADFGRSPASPAWGLGFERIPVEKIGPYQDDPRATWPIIEAAGVREHR